MHINVPNYESDRPCDFKFRWHPDRPFNDDDRDTYIGVWVIDDDCIYLDIGAYNPSYIKVKVTDGIIHPIGQPIKDPKTGVDFYMDHIQRAYNEWLLNKAIEENMKHEQHI